MPKKYSRLFEAVMKLEQFFTLMIVLSVAILLQPVSSSFVHGEPYAVLGFVSYSVTLAFVFLYTVFHTKTLALVSSFLIALQLCLVLYADCSNLDTFHLILSLSTAGGLVALGFLVMGKAFDDYAIREKNKSLIAAQLFYLIGYPLSITIACLFEFMAPGVISDFVIYGYILCACLFISIFIRDGLMLTSLSSIIWASYFVYVYIKYRHTEALWVTTFIVQAVYLIMALYLVGSAYTLESAETEDG